MMRIKPVILLTGLAGAVAAAGTPGRDDADSVANATAGLIAGKPQQCLPPRLNTTLKADGSTLIYRVSRTMVYINRTTGGCENVGRGDILVTTSNFGRTCSGDIARTVDSASRFPTGSCGLTDFIPYSSKGS